MAIFPPGILRMRLSLNPPILCSSLGLGLKVCATQFLWQLVRLLGLKVRVIVATEIKGVCYHNLVRKADQWDCFTLRSSDSLYLLKYS